MILALQHGSIDGIKPDQKEARSGANTALHQAKCEDKTGKQSGSTLYHRLTANSDTIQDELFAFQNSCCDAPYTPQNLCNRYLIKNGDKQI